VGRVGQNLIVVEATTGHSRLQHAGWSPTSPFGTGPDRRFQRSWDTATGLLLIAASSGVSNVFIHRAWYLHVMCATTIITTPV